MWMRHITQVVSHIWINDIVNMNTSFHTPINESWHTQMSHVTQACHTNELVMSHMNKSCHIWLSHVTRLNESCHEDNTRHSNKSRCTYEYVTSHEYMSHVTHQRFMAHRQNVSLHMIDTCHIWMGHVTRLTAPCHTGETCHLNTSCCTSEYVTSHK